jgi:uncharacterized protein YdeI (BOF family)
MRRGVLVLLVPLVLSLTLAACGGGSKTKANEVKLTPTAYVIAAAKKSSQATSEHMSMKGSVTVAGQLVTITGDGDFDNAKRNGSMHLTFNASGLTGDLDEVIDGTTIYMRSPLFADALPKGKTWLKLDLQKAVASQGIDFSALGSQDPTQTLAQLKAIANVTEVGTEQIDGVDTTHYRGRIDLAKVPQGAKIKALTDAAYGPYNVWVGKDDGYVRRVKFSFSTKLKDAGRQSIALTSDFSDFGKEVSVTVPADADTFDATNQSIKGLGG